MKKLWQQKALTLGILVFGLDQLSKLIVRISNQNLIFNSGVSFGVGDSNTFSLILSILAMIVVLWIARGWWYRYWIGLALIVGGGLSNLLDRILWQAVIDWLPLFGGIRNNLADIFINLGIIWLLWQVFRNSSKEKN